jgi:hypothetical protein
MATLDDIQARLSAEIDRLVAARMASPRTGPGPTAESTAALAREIEARVMQPASAAEAPSSTLLSPLPDLYRMKKRCRPSPMRSRRSSSKA